MNSEIKEKLQEAKEWLQKEYATIRTGQASPALLDSVKVECFGSVLPLNQVANVGIEDARTLRISPWDASQVAAIEQAIRDTDQGVSIATDSSGVRVMFPELTVERREQLLKLAKSKFEDSRIAVRSTRDDAMKQIEKSEKAGDISKDEKFTQKDLIQQDVDAVNKELDYLFSQKEQELKK
ncbi:MAG: ribosome recycling factor [Candidatus Paceibacteria bacterium]|jgi:ribosome recycling factor